MARILNLEAYPLAETISDDSYLVGTDVTDNKETKNFKIEDLKTHILPDPLIPGTFENATVVVDSDGQISSVTQGASGSSKWSFSLGGNDIYRNSNVGIGDFSAADPAQKLEVQGKVQVSGADAEFIGDINGAIRFNAKAGEALSKGDVVYISEISGNIPVVSKADASDSAKMPAFGLAFAAASLNSSVEVITFGTLSSIDTSAFSLGDTVYVSTTAGELTNTPPTGEANLLQNIGKVQRVQASSGSIKVGGAGRTNATPNLNEGSLFIGNSSNQSSTLAIGGASTFLKSDGTTAAWSSISSSDLPANLALVGTYTDGFVPRWNATTNTLGLSNIKDDGTTISISSNTANTPDSTTDLSVTAGFDKRALKVNQSWGPNEAAKITVSRTDLGTSPTTAPVTGLFIDATSGKEAAGDFKHIKLTTELSIAPRTTPKTIDNVFGIQLSDYSAVSSVTANNLYQIYLGDIDALTKGLGEFYGIYQKEASIKNYLAGNVGIGTTPVASKTLAVGGNSIISGQLDLNGSGDSKLKLINSIAQDTSGNNYMTWYQSNGSDRRGYLGFTDPNTFNINVQESAGTSQIILDADEIILNSSDETQSGTIKSGVWEATPIADAYIAEDYLTATSGAAQRLAVFDGTDSVEGDANLTWSGAQINIEDAANNLTELRANYLKVANQDDDANLYLEGYGAGHRGEIELRAANGTISAKTATLSGNTIANISSWGHSGTGFRKGGNISFAATEDYTEGSAYGTRFVLQTVADGSTSLVTRYATDGDGDHNFTGNVKVDGQAYSAIQSASTPTTSQTIDWNDGNVAIVDLGSATGTVTLTLTNPKAGASYFIKIVQGANLVDITFPSTVKFAGNTTQPYVLDVTATDNAIDAVALTCISDSGTVEYLANVSQNYG